MAAFDEKSLHGRFDLVKLSVASSTQISSRISAVITNLDLDDGVSGDGSRDSSAMSSPTSCLVALTAKAKAASKLISIAEIAKRELAVKGVKCFQYNALSSQMVEIERKPKSKNGGIDEDKSDDAFETMGAATPEVMSATKKRNVPVMTIYLATSQVKELKAAYSEQT